MDEHGLQLLEITGFSTNTLADAIRNALVRAAQTVSPAQIQWVEKQETYEIFDCGQGIGWQVTLQLGVRVENEVPIGTCVCTVLSEEERVIPSSDSSVDST